MIPEYHKPPNGQLHEIRANKRAAARSSDHYLYLKARHDAIVAHQSDAVRRRIEGVRSRYEGSPAVIEKPPKPPPSIAGMAFDRAAAVVIAQTFNITEDLLIGEGKLRPQIVARFALYLLLRRHGLSFPKIGKAVKRNVQTVQSGILRAETFYDSSHDWRAKFLEALRLFEACFPKPEKTKHED